MEKISSFKKLQIGHWLKGEYVRIQKFKEQGETPSQVEKEILAKYKNQDMNKLTELERELMDQCSAEENYEIGCLYAAIEDDYDEPNYPIALLFYEKAASQGYVIAQNSLGWEYAILEDYRKSFKWFSKAAAQGDDESQYELGFAYQNGRGVKQNHKEAFKWYTKAAEQGWDQAQNNLGMMYANGQGVKKDDKEAFKWFTKAAEQGNDGAQNNLGLAYRDGLGVKQDYKKAVKWFSKAAEQEFDDAQTSLGVLYFNGQGVQQDYKNAIKWLTKAAKQGNIIAQNNLGVAYDNGLGVKQDYKKAFKWFSKAAEQGYDLAQNNLGEVYQNGRGVKQDYKNAVKWYTRAALQSYDIAQNNLGVMYNAGNGVKKDDKEAFMWFSKAALQDQALAQTNLGVMYANGYGVLKDYKMAVKWFTKAAEQDYANAQLYLARIYTKGNGIPQDDKKAAKWYLKAAEQNSVEAQIKIGIMYLDGIGVLKDHKEAAKWCIKAAEQGNTYAQYILYMRANDLNIDTKESIDWLHKSAGIDILASAKYDFKRAKNFNSKLINSYKKLVYKGYAKSQYLLGTIYFEKGGVRSLPKAKYWIKKAYENNDKDVRKKAEDFWNKNELWNYKDYRYKNIDEPSDVEKIRNFGNQALTPEEILLRALFSANDSFVIGEAYMNSKIVLRDPLEAIKYYENAAEYGDRKEDENRGNDEAKYKLGVIYYEENSIKDYDKSKYWINQAYEGVDTEISKKAEAFWNKHKLWNY